MDDVVKLDRAKTEVLATRANGLRNIFGLGCGQHEYDVIGRFLQGLEQRVEGSVGDLVGFVEDINFEAVARWPVASGFPELADFIDPAIGGGVDFDHVYRVSGTDFHAGFANSAGLGDGMIFRPAIQGRGQDSSHGGLTDAAVATEDVAVSAASLRNSVLEGAGDVLLSDDLREPLGTVFASQDGVSHGGRRLDYT